MTNGQSNGRICDNCQGLEECRQEAKGFFPLKEEYRGEIYTVLHMCQFERQQRNARAYNNLISVAKIPPKYAEADFSKYRVTADNAKAVEEAKKAANENSGLLIHGNRGTGKTMLASIMANTLVNRGVNVLFLSSPDLFNTLRDSFYDGNNKKTLELVKDAAHLVVDDFGAEKLTSWALEQWFIIINYRYNNRKPITLTTNYEPKLLAGKLIGENGDRHASARIMSRLQEMCKFVHIGGSDWRAQKWQQQRLNL